MVHEYVNNGSDIYRESFRIIRSEANLDRFPTDVEGVVVRMIHAAADPAIADDIAFTLHDGHWHYPIPTTARQRNDLLHQGPSLGRYRSGEKYDEDLRRGGLVG